MPVTWIDTTAHDFETFEICPETQPLLWRMEEKHFWHAARNEWILDTLRRYAGKSKGRFLEVGCGSGAATWLSREPDMKSLASTPPRF